MCAKLPYSLLPGDRVAASRMFDAPGGRRTRGEHVPSHARHQEGAPTRALHTRRTKRTGRRDRLLTSAQQIYGVSLALAAVVVLLWQGSLVLLAIGALLLGLLAVAVFLVLVRRMSAGNGGRAP